MQNEILLVGNIIGMILQSIYYAYFIITTKGIKKRRLLFIGAVMLEYTFLKLVCGLNYTINFELMFGALMVLLLNIIYNQKFKITDFIIYIISIVCFGIISIIVSLTIGMNLVGLIFTNLFSILLIFLFRHKLIKIELFFNKFWNRHKENKVLKSITIRGFSSVLTILTFVLLHFWLIYGILIVRR